MSEFDQIRAALESHADLVITRVALTLADLGSKREWSLEDNFGTAEEIVGIATEVGLPSAGDQTEEALAFYRAAAKELGFDVEEDES